MTNIRFFHERQTNIFETTFQSNESFITDVIIKVGPEKHQFNCHRLVLASTSNFLKSILLSATPGTIPVILLPETSFSVAELILTYMYYGEVNIPSESYAEFVDTCSLLKIKPGHDDFLEEKSEIYKISDEGEIEMEDEQTSEILPENQIVQQETTMEKEIERNISKKVENNGIPSEDRDVALLKPSKKVLQNKTKKFFGKIPVTPEITITVQETLIKAIRRAYTELEIPITAKVQKKILQSKIVVEDNILTKGVHVCALCGPRKEFSFHYSSYGAIEVKVSYKIQSFKKHLVKYHTEFVGIDKNSLFMN